RQPRFTHGGAARPHRLPAQPERPTREPPQDVGGGFHRLALGGVPGGGVGWQAAAIGHERPGAARAAAATLQRPRAVLADRRRGRHRLGLPPLLVRDGHPSGIVHGYTPTALVSRSPGAAAGAYPPCAQPRKSRAWPWFSWRRTRHPPPGRR